MRAIIDTDAFVKLGVAGLLEPWILACGIELPECRRLAALPKQLERGKIAALLTADQRASLRPLAESIPRLTTGDSSEWIDRFSSSGADFDGGDAEVLAAAAGHADCLILTGDKRAIRLIGRVDGLVDVLAGRVVTMEAVVLHMTKKQGAEWVQPLLAPTAVIDKAFTVFQFGDLEAAVRSYQRDFARELPQNLLWGD